MPQAYQEKQAGEAGRGLFTTKDQKPGSLVLQDKSPFVAVLDSPILTRACSWCYTFIDEAGPDDKVSVKACTGCKILRYCGKTCQSASWAHSHKYECKIFKSLYPQILPNTARMILQILLRFKNNLIPKKDWESFLKLQHHMDDIEKSIRSGNEYHQEMLQNIQLMARAGKEYSGSTESPGYIESLVGRLLTNTLTLTSPLFTPIGLMLSSPAALLNHSCDPNCAIVYNGRSLDVRLLNQSKPGIELTIAYTHTTLSVESRRSDLQTKYHFVCQCSQCVNGLTLNHPESELDLNIGATLLSNTNMTEVSTLLMEAKTKPASEGLLYIAKAYQLFASTPAYPAWLSPLYQLRFDLIMALQANKLWVGAFIQSLIIHFISQPVAYPQLAHPARVARIWVLAKIAGHIGGLANEPEFAASSGALEEGELAKSLGTKYGLDWGLIVFALVKEVSDQILKSHGIESKLSMEVGREFANLKEEARRELREPSTEDTNDVMLKLETVAREGWSWWTQEMKIQRNSQKMLTLSNGMESQDAVGILLE